MARLGGSRFWVRAAFVGLLAFAPLQYIFAHYWVEPWPAMMMPRFRMPADEPNHFALKRITAVTDSGEELSLEPGELFPDISGVTPTVLSLNFSPRARPPVATRPEDALLRLYSGYPVSNYWSSRQGIPHGNDDDSRAWLESLLADRYPG